MGKINWTRVLLGGLVAGVVGNILFFAAWGPLVGRTLSAVLQTLGHPMQETVGTAVSMIVLVFVMGILYIWLYAAVRPRYGGGPGTAALLGVVLGLLVGVSPDIGWGLMLRFIPAKVWVGDALFGLVASVLMTVLGAWVYKEGMR
jgi:hypothetical protein